MDSRIHFAKRALSVGLDDKNYLNLSQMREINRAVHNKNPSILLNEKFSRMSVSPSVSTTDKSGSGFQLQILKKTINRQRLMVGSGDQNMSRLRSELKQLDIESTKREFWNKQNYSKLKQLEENIERTLKKQVEEVVNRDVYLHLLKRMKKTKIFLDIKANFVNQDLKVSESVLKSAVKKQMDTKESKTNILSFFQQFKGTVEEETDMGHVRINDLEVDIEKSKIIADRREEWKKHRESMFEVAVVEDRSKKNIGMKESLILHKMWHFTLTKLFEKKKNKFQKLEEAAQRVKAFTGLSEISLVVENYLTKENTYAGLLKTVKEKEQNCDKIKEKIEELQKKVLDIENKDLEMGKIEVAALVEKRILRENLELNEKKHLVENVYAKVRTWMKLTVRKLNLIVGNKRVVESGEDSMKVYMGEIRRICQEAIGKHNFSKSLGQVIEKNRKKAVNSVISQYSKMQRSVKKEEILSESDLIGC